MFVKQFREQEVRVADPLRPGRRIFETRLNPTGCHGISHGGVEYQGDEDGWFEVPDDVGQYLKGFRGQQGETFYTPAEVDEEIVAGRIKATPEDALPPPPPAKPAGKTTKAS